MPRASLLGRLRVRLARSVMRWASAGAGYSPYGSYSGAGTMYGLFGGLPGTQFDFAAEVGDPAQNSAVAAGLNWYADNFSEPRLDVVRTLADGTRTPVRGHPLPALIDNPNGFYDGDSLWSATIISYCVDGNAYWLKARGAAGAGRPVELWYVPHWMIRPRWSLDGSDFISHYDYLVNGVVEKKERQDVVHFRFGLDPYTQGRTGLSRLKSVLREIMSDNEASTYTAAVLRNLGIIGVLVSPKDAGESIGKEGRAELEALFEGKTTGVNRAKTLVSSGRIDVTNLAVTPEQMALDKIRSVPEARICAALRLPPMVLGLNVGDQQRTYANYAEARRAAYHDGLIPLQKRMAATLDAQLLGDFL